MISDKSLVIYRNHPALVASHEGDKFTITVFGGDSAKVRRKDVELIHSGPCTFKDLEIPLPPGYVLEAWELMSNESSPDGASAGINNLALKDEVCCLGKVFDSGFNTSKNALKGEVLNPSHTINLKELAELVYGVFTPRTAWESWELLRAGTYFSGDINSIKARPIAAVEAEEKRLMEKQKEAGDRTAFLEKLRKLPPFTFAASAEAPDFPETDRRFLQDVEALDLGRSEKSRTMKELGKGETPEEAHRLLLAAGAWTPWDNPHPERFGLNRDSAKSIPSLPPEEKRLDLTWLPAYAIDNLWSEDPDDAVSLEGPCSEGCHCLWVHVADPAASVIPESPADMEARGRGATLYLPEGPSRMLAPDVLPLFALGLNETSPALSFKISLKPNLTIAEVEIFPSTVSVTRLSYGEADTLIANGGKSGERLRALAALTNRYMERRLDTGAVIIDLPETHIQVILNGHIAENRISVIPVPSYRSADMVRECMILAGEAVAHWALQRKLPFPFISQEAGELPEKRLPGLAGAWQLRRCMRPRNLSAKPAVHWGLGLDEYTQVTSPLRRYTDLLCHQQIRAWLNRNEGRGEEPLDEEEVLLRVSAAEAAAAATSRAERASRAHWLAVYFLDKLDKKDTGGWEAVVLDRKGNRGTVVIPALGLETQVNMQGTEKPNDIIELKLLSVKIPEGEAGFALA